MYFATYSEHPSDLKKMVNKILRLGNLIVYIRKHVIFLIQTPSRTFKFSFHIAQVFYLLAVFLYINFLTILYLGDILK